MDLVRELEIGRSANDGRMTGGSGTKGWGGALFGFTPGKRG